MSPVVLPDPKDEEALADPFFSASDRLDEPLTDARGLAAHGAIEQAFVAARRARFTRYVKIATAVGAFVCVAAFAPSVLEPTQRATPAIAPPAAPVDLDTSAADARLAAARESSAAEEALERGDFEEAIRAAARSIAHDPGPAATWVLLGDAYARAGRSAEARQAYRACVDGAHTDVERCVDRLR